MTDKKKKPEEKAEDISTQQEEQPQSEPTDTKESISDTEESDQPIDEQEPPVLDTSADEKDFDDDKQPEDEPLEEQVESKQKPKQKEQSGKKKSSEEVKDQKKSSKKKDEEDEDFQYIIRIANTDIDGNKNVVMGLTQIKGIGRHMASLIADETGIDRKLKMGKLDEKQIQKIKSVLEQIESIAPGWMLNHRKDMDTGKNRHLISSEVQLRLRDDVNLLKMIRSYRGIRHESGLPVRGQRTRANNRRGLALGVSKKRE